MPADIIRLNRMIFHAYHGYWDEERQVGQRFEVDVELQVNVQQAASSDNIRDTVDLYKVYQTVEHVVTKNTFKLVETLTQVIADTLLREFNLAQVRVRVRKPNSPVPGISDGIEVEIQRSAAMAG
ncbi:MAG: Dihydroneopterin aldolase [bacterium]|nr:Dihydroneopterin aldolase [bacterium]MCK6562380.1 dihydroneopterin aldolase [bacterium]NUM66234.1 dihydroneopterin aldolase [candidate division KSB1 bacterium]